PQADAAGKYQSVFKSTDSGAHWTSVTTSGVSYTEAGTGDVWWLSVANSRSMLDGSTYIASQLLVDPADPASLYVSGRAGVWHSADGGAHWNPHVAGLGATIDVEALADPNVAGRIYATDVDWPFLVSSDGLAHVAMNVPKDGSVTSNSAAAMALDTATTPSTVYVGGDSGGARRDVWA